MTATSLDQQPTIKLSANTLDTYAAAAGRKYMNLCNRVKQKVKSVPVLDKVVKTVKEWDQKMTQKHGAAYKYAKGAVIGTAIGVGLAVAGAEVATAYAAVNAVRAAGGLLAQAEQARQKGEADGFSDFASKNKMAVGIAAVSVGLSAAGITAGVVENQVAATVISSTRQATIGGMMATATANKIHQINTALKSGEITAEQAKQAKKEEYAEFAGNLTGLMAVSQISAHMQGSSANQQTEPTIEGGVLPEVVVEAPTPTIDGGTLPGVVVEAPTPTINGGTLPEVVVEAPAPTINGGTLPEVVVEAPAPTIDGGTLPEVVVTAERPDEPRISKIDLPKTMPVPTIEPLHPDPVLPEIRTPADQRPISIEKDTFVSYSQQVSPTTHAVNLDISSNDHVNNSIEDASLFVKVQDVENSQSKIMMMSVQENGKFADVPIMHIDENGKVTQLPDWHAMPDANGDCHLSDQEIKDWSSKRQASLQTVLSEQEARNVVTTELNQEAKLYNGDNIHSVKAEQNSGTTSYKGPADGLNKDGINAADKVGLIGEKQADKIANSAKEIMCNRIDTQGNACKVQATDQQIKVADILLRSAANRVK